MTSKQVKELGEQVLEDFKSGRGVTGLMTPDVYQNGNDWSKETPQRAPRTFKSKTGEVLPLRTIPAMIVRQLYADEGGKPEIPMVDVTIAKRTIKQANDKDPDYLKALDKWEEDRGFRIMVYILTRGVCVDPGKQDIERLREFFPSSSLAQLKYAWILELLQDDDEAGDLMDAILGQTVPTEGGIEQAEAAFPGEDQQ